MKQENGQFLFSATDLANHLSCAHLTELDRLVAEGSLKFEYHPDPMVDLLSELGQRHEQAYLEALRAADKTVLELTDFGGSANIEAAVQAMRVGVDVIAQASLQSSPWHGRADFLIKVDQPSQLGAWSYEVIDAKLSQTTRARAVLQLCVYTDIVGQLQGRLPRNMHVVKPGEPFTDETLRVADFMAYYRMCKRRFETQFRSGPDGTSYPQPNPHCEVCGWWNRCHQTWRDDDHLSFVAGISKLQIAELEEHDITTLESFATAAKPLSEPPRRGSLESFKKVHRQAQIQLAGRRSGQPEYEFNEVEVERGFLRLPEPDPGDIFFDIEGNPRAIGEGLEYLLGFAFDTGGQQEYRSLWGFTKADEKRAFESFMDFVMRRWADHPGMHIYHFAPYEPSALKRLAIRHATRENELDQLLRGKRLVDLFAVTRQGIRASVESYSIKNLEQFYGYERAEELDEARQALRQVERLIELSLPLSTHGICPTASAAGGSSPEPQALASGATEPGPDHGQSPTSDSSVPHGICPTASAAVDSSPEPQALASGATEPGPDHAQSPASDSSVPHGICPTASAAGGSSPEPQALASGATEPGPTHPQAKVSPYSLIRHRNADEALAATRAELNRLITPELRSIVETYNKDDCISTWKLRDWLEHLRQELINRGQNLPRPPSSDGDPSEGVQERAEEVQQVFDELTQDIEDEPHEPEQHARWLLAHMLEYFRREDKCTWWEYLRLRELEPADALKDRHAIYGLRYVCELPKEGKERNLTHRYRFAPQESTIEAGDSVHEVLGEIFKTKIGTVRSIDLNAGTIDIKKRRSTVRGDAQEESPVHVHLTAIFTFKRIKPHPMPESLLEFARQVIRGETQSARYDLLAKRPPRLKTLALPSEGDQIDVAIRLAADLDHSVLPIQGPPGSGKTYIGSHMIAALSRAGKRIGVTAVSHKVIVNLLESVIKESKKEGPVPVAHQGGGDDVPDGVERLANKDESAEALDNGYVVGGTAWLWSNSEMEGQLDYLFIDEAGQMSLAMALAAGRAAKNIVLLGDPQQLEQPQQGTHPENSGVAALLHVLDGAETMPDDRGLFLHNTWRLHPLICDFTSEQYYDGRLKPQPGLEHQEIFGDSPYTGHGLQYIPVAHENNQNRSDEEIAAIADIVAQLANGNHHWSNKQSELSTITLEHILIVAPYNAKVSALRSALPDGARVGTVDKFQGQEAPIVVYSMTSSSVADAPRGMSFLYSRNRFNVATSRARCLVLLVGSPPLFEPDCALPDHMRMANGLCRYLELVSLRVP